MRPRRSPAAWRSAASSRRPCCGPPPAPARPDPRPNVLVVLTDDQTLDTIRSRPAGDAVAPVAVARSVGALAVVPATRSPRRRCAARRAPRSSPAGTTHRPTSATTRRARTSTTRTRCRCGCTTAGYTTGLVGKYLNFYPWGRRAVRPARLGSLVRQGEPDESTSYYDYDVVDQGSWRHFGAVPRTTPPTCSGAEAVRFVQDAPADAPWFLYFSPNAPHLPWIPAPRVRGRVRRRGAADPAVCDVLNDVARQARVRTGARRPRPRPTDRAISRTIATSARCCCRSTHGSTRS